MTERGQQYGSAERDAPGDDGHGRQQEQGVGAGPGERAVAGPHGVETERFGTPCLFDQLLHVVIAAYGLIARR